MPHHQPPGPEYTELVGPVLSPAQSQPHGLQLPKLDIFGTVVARFESQLLDQAEQAVLKTMLGLQF